MLHDLLAEPDSVAGVGGIVGDVNGFRPLGNGTGIRNLGVVPHLAVGVGVCELNELGDGLHSGAGRCGNRGLALRTTLGGYQDNAVSTADTEHRSCRCVLEDGDALDFVGVQL